MDDVVGMQRGQPPSDVERYGLAVAMPLKCALRVGSECFSQVAALRNDPLFW